MKFWDKSLQFVYMFQWSLLLSEFQWLLTFQLFTFPPLSSLLLSSDAQLNAAWEMGVWEKVHAYMQIYKEEGRLS